MNKYIFMLLKIICWLIIGVYLLGCIMVHQIFVEMTRPNTGVWCGNCIVDPLSLILNLGTPLSFVALIILSVWWYWGLMPRWSVILAWLLFLVGTTLLFVYGIYIFGGSDKHHLSEIIWWLRPIGGFLGV